MFFLWISALCWVIDCHCELVGFPPAQGIKGNVSDECTVCPLNWWTHPNATLCLDTLQEPGSARSADRRRTGRNCCTRKPIRSNVDMQSQSEGRELSSSKECKCIKMRSLISGIAASSLKIPVGQESLFWNKLPGYTNGGVITPWLHCYHNMLKMLVKTHKHKTHVVINWNYL